MLGQTYPNRRYLMGATSIGQVDDTLPDVSDYPANGTIFDRLDAQGITWRDYYTTLPTTLLYPPLYIKNHGTKILPVAQFFTDAAAGALPGFCFVEPDYGKQSEENPQNIVAGEAFVAQVVRAVMAGPNWPKTLLAPKSARKIPIIVASKPLFGCDAFCATLLTTSRALLSRK